MATREDIMAEIQRRQGATQAAPPAVDRVAILAELQRRGVQETGGQNVAAAPAVDEQAQSRGIGRTARAKELGAQSRANQAAAIKAIEESNPALAALIAEMGGIERFLVGAGKGLTDIARGVGLADQADETERAAFEALQSVSTASKVGEVVGQAAPFLAPGLGVANLATQGARVGASAALGALEGGVISAGTGGDAGEVLASAAGGAALLGAGEALAPVINSIGRAVAKKFRSGTASVGAGVDIGEVLVSKGVDPDDLALAAKELEAGGDIAGNAERAAVFERLGITPTEAQRTRDIDLFIEQQDAFRKTGRVRQALDAQEAQLTEKTAEVVSKVGATQDPSSVIDVVTDRSLRLDGEIGDLYTLARDRASGESNVKMASGVESLRKNAPLNARSEGTVQAIKEQMEAMGVTKKFKPTGRINVQQSEELRQFANTLFDGANPIAKRVIADFKSGLDDDVFRAAGEDVFKAARAAKTNFEKGLSKQAKNKFDQNRTSLVRDMLENRVAPEDTIKIIKAGSKYKSADLEDLKRYLAAGSPEDVARGQAAWNDVRGGAIEFIRDTAFTGPLRTDGSKSLSRAGIDKAFKAIGQDKINVLFSKQEREFLKDLASVAALKEPPPGTFTGTGPTGLAVKQLGDRLLRNSGVPGADLAKDIVGGVLGGRSTRKQEQRVLKLVNDSDRIQKQNAKRAFETLRRSQVGQSAAVAPLAAVSVTAQDEQ